MVSFPCLHQVAVGEAMGLFEALQWLSDMSFENVDFELDSKVTCDAFLSRRDDISEFGHVIASCKALFSAFFTNSRVEFTMRQANALMYLQERLHFSLVPLFIIASHLALTILLLMKCNEHVSQKKKKEIEISVNFDSFSPCYWKESPCLRSNSV